MKNLHEIHVFWKFVCFLLLWNALFKRISNNVVYYVWDLNRNFQVLEQNIEDIDQKYQGFDQIFEIMTEKFKISTEIFNFWTEIFEIYTKMSYSKIRKNMKWIFPPRFAKFG